MTAATPLADQFFRNFATMRPKGINKKSQILETLGERVLELWLTAKKPPPPPPRANRVKYLTFDRCFYKTLLYSTYREEQRPTLESPGLSAWLGMWGSPLSKKDHFTLPQNICTHRKFCKKVAKIAMKTSHLS